MKLQLSKEDMLIAIQDLVRFQVGQNTVVDGLTFTNVEGKQFAVTRIEVDFHNAK